MTRVQLNVNLASDIVIRPTSKGTNLYTFNVVDVDPHLYKPQYFACTCFDGDTINALGEVKKGTHLVIIGELRNNTYTDKNNITRTVTNILVGSVFRYNEYISMYCDSDVGKE